MSDTFSLAVATPSHRGLFTTSYVRSVWGLQKACLARGIRVELLTLTNQSLVDRARNIITSFFLYKTDYSHMLFLDDDMGFNVDDIMRMLDWHQYDVVAAMYPRKEIDWTRIKEAVLAHPEIDPALLPQIAGQYGGMHTFLQEGDTPAGALDAPMPVRETGTGIMLIARACLEHLAQQNIPSAKPGGATDFPVHEFFSQKVIDDRLVGEDFYFCNLVREHGRTVYGCAWPNVVHTGTCDFIGDFPSIMSLS
ncbi:hypothetical protein Bsp3421_002658 [Burkholderia sp. FERM BP-3421]|uniref:hypothetical protein n=1 Tax=Burkholderia sp. FERM BP-3421 TaxID=1494466 RepID=UPI00235F7506|nr:hypothetical protein [Burkholderia sp. FERM BP-3421]WDD92637.1 hypothetical protein Bsp3421_002658 [Burkholderia sp. FERM BP-3421]